MPSVVVTKGVCQSHGYATGTAHTLQLSVIIVYLCWDALIQIPTCRDLWPHPLHCWRNPCHSLWSWIRYQPDYRIKQDMSRVKKKKNRGLLCTYHWLNLQHWVGFYIAVHKYFEYFRALFLFSRALFAFQGWNRPDPIYFSPCHVNVPQ